MAVRSQRVLTSFLAGDDSRRPSADRNSAIRITLAPKAGIEPSAQPPVRIFLGTESAQFRAERAFVWSIERVRDPARTYEIHLMKDFAGFERRLWLTGFTNYRFAIPELAGCEGRAIYNDADQIYLEDPAHLFDTPMGEHGVLSINDRDTSVMLIDCERMAELWSWETARSSKNRELEARMRAQPGLWGELDAGWNARDEEYVPGRSRLVHYTTIHTQPWRPSPRDYVYRANVAQDIWMQIEREADAAGFHLFDAAVPSPLFDTRNAHNRAEPRDPARLRDYRRLVIDADAASFHYVSDEAPADLARTIDLAAPAVTTATPETERNASVSDAATDVVAADGLARLPDLDLPWVLDRLFARARCAVIVSVSVDADATRMCPADPYWWYAQLAAAGARHPGRHWRLVVHRRRRLVRGRRRWRWSGGALLRVPPSTWALLHYKTGHRSQTLGVADALGWRYETREIGRDVAAYPAAALRARFSPREPALTRDIRPPWPELIVASGWLPGRVARWIAARNFGNTRLVLLGRRGGPVGESQDMAIACAHFGLVPHPRHIETVLPPNKVGEARLAEAAARWPDLYGHSAGVNVAFLVGGTSAQHELDARTAGRLMGRLNEAAKAIDGRLAVLTSRRTGEDALAALRAHADADVIFEPWRAFAAEADNPYLGYLATADILVVTGESESMLAEAVATGKPVYICPLPERAPGTRRRVADWVEHQARTDRFNARGSRRPQQGLQYLCARLIEQRIALPRRDMDALHQALVERNRARVFDAGLERWQPPAWHEIDDLAQRIRCWLAPAVHAGAEPHSDGAETANENDAARA